MELLPNNEIANMVSYPDWDNFPQPKLYADTARSCPNWDNSVVVQPHFLFSNQPNLALGPMLLQPLIHQTTLEPTRLD